MKRKDSSEELKWREDDEYDTRGEEKMKKEEEEERYRKRRCLRITLKGEAEELRAA